MTVSITGLTLPDAEWTVAYAQSVFSQVTGGIPPYTFQILVQTADNNNWTISGTAEITGTPPARNYLVTNASVQLATETGEFLTT